MAMSFLPRNGFFAACWAHARRKFVEVPDYSPAKEIVGRIKDLYRIESKLRENSEDNRATYRQKYATPIMEKIKEILEREKPRQLPKGTFGKAIKYTLERWGKLTLYLEHSPLEIDNNLVENAIRPTAIGKKNFLFFLQSRFRSDQYSHLQSDRNLSQT